MCGIALLLSYITRHDAAAGGQDVRAPILAALLSAALAAITAAHRRYGTTSLLPTLITDCLANMRAANAAVVDLLSSALDIPKRAIRIVRATPPSAGVSSTPRLT